MSKRKCYDYTKAIVRDKTTTSHTGGSVTASGSGKNVSVSNNIRTDIKQEILLEFPDGYILKTVLINESLDAPIGKAILIAFVKGAPIAYQVNRNGQVHSLGYASQRSTMSGQEFMLLAAPIAGTLFGLGCAFAPDKFYGKCYENGEMKEHHAGQVVAGLGLVGTALSMWVMKSWIPYFIGTAISGVATTIIAMIHYGRENRGRKLLLEDVKRDFDAMQADL